MLTLLPDQTLRLDHDGVAYAPIASDAALGALLFTLRVEDIDLSGARVADRTELRLSLASARQYAHILARHAGRAARSEALLPAIVPESAARGWLVSAAAAVPAAEQERFCWRVARRLGAEPWSDGHAAIELHNQQFALFGTDFEEAEGEARAPLEEEGDPALGPGPDIEPREDTRGQV